MLVLFLVYSQGELLKRSEIEIKSKWRMKVFSLFLIFEVWNICGKKKEKREYTCFYYS